MRGEGGREPEIDGIATGVRGSGGLREGKGTPALDGVGTLNGPHLTGPSDAVCVSINMWQPSYNGKYLGMLITGKNSGL